MDIDELMNIVPASETATEPTTASTESSDPVLIPNNVDFTLRTSIGNMKYNGIDIKNLSGTVKMKELKDAGGNTIRTWGLENAQAILDEAYSLGLKVMLGFWVQHESHGFAYNDDDNVKNQLVTKKRSNRL